MFIDTFQVWETFSRLPNENCLVRNGWKPRYHPCTGEINKFILNGKKGEHAPKLTISESYHGFWYVRAEVTPAAWINGSNVNFLGESDFHSSLDLLSEMVSDLSGYKFDAYLARVSKVDFTRNFLVGEPAVLPIVRKYHDFSIPRYITQPYPESVYFENAGKELTKLYKLYSKYHEMLKNSDNLTELEKAKGILRLEVSFRKSAVNRLAKSLKLESHQAKNILTQTTAMQVLDNAMKKLQFSKLLTEEKVSVEKLFDMFSTNKAYMLTGFLYLQDKHGDDHSAIPNNKVSKRTLKRHREDCLKAGLLSL